jgi:hypothetical protein
VSHIAYCLDWRVKEVFPINRVPTKVEVKLGRLTETLERAERDIQEFIEVVSR